MTKGQFEYYSLEMHKNRYDNFFSQFLELVFFPIINNIYNKSMKFLRKKLNNYHQNLSVISNISVYYRQIRSIKDMIKSAPASTSCNIKVQLQNNN
jgi:hypothetical protein